MSLSEFPAWGENFELIRQYVSDHEAHGGLERLHDEGLEMLQALLDAVDVLRTTKGERRGDMTRRMPALGTSESIELDTIFPKIGELPIPMLLTCPTCGERHIDEGEWTTRPHHTHACQSCGMVWRPAKVDTVGVRFLPGFRGE